MTIQEIFDYVDEIKANSFSTLAKTIWLNEIEGKIQNEIMLLAQPECIRYVYESHSESGMKFTDDHTLVLPRPIKAHIGGMLTISELTQLSDNNITAEILNISTDGKTYTFENGTFAAEGEDSGELDFDGKDTELLVQYPFDRIYASWLLVKISGHLEESNQDANATAKFKDDWEIFAAWYADTYRPADGVPTFKGYYLRGKTGERGKDGETGPAGKGIVRLYVESGRLKYELDDGSTGDAGPMSGIEIDPTLTIEGAAADAAATGAALGELGTAIVGAVETLGDKVDKVAGKGLSTNDYTDADKAKVAASASENYVDGEINDLQGQIDALISKSDVVDVVGSYAELVAYDTSTLGDNDVVKVLDDSTHSNQRSYYRWVITVGVGAWVYVGSEAIGYTKAQTDTYLNAKLDKNGDGSNVTAAFTEAASRTNISTGEKLSVMFGKIKKFFADLKTVAFTNSYNDLDDKPTIPTVNDAVLTIKQGGVTKGTFSANASSATEINLDAGGGEGDGGDVYYSGVLTSGSNSVVVNLTNFPYSAEVPPTEYKLVHDSAGNIGVITTLTTEGHPVPTTRATILRLVEGALKDELNEYVAIAQGATNVNKVLAVGSDGNLTVKAITDIIADGDEVSY